MLPWKIWHVTEGIVQNLQWFFLLIYKFKNEWLLELKISKHLMVTFSLKRYYPNELNNNACKTSRGGVEEYHCILLHRCFCLGFYPCILMARLYGFN